MHPKVKRLTKQSYTFALFELSVGTNHAVILPALDTGHLVLAPTLYGKIFTSQQMPRGLANVLPQRNKEGVFKNSTTEKF